VQCGYEECLRLGGLKVGGGVFFEVINLERPNPTYLSTSVNQTCVR